MGKARIDGADLAEIIKNLEARGEDTTQLRALQEQMGRKQTRGDDTISDEEHIEILMRQSPVEDGDGLSCVVCGTICTKLYSGVCESCFRDWALTTKRRK
jgi:hypothetical protein